MGLAASCRRLGVVLAPALLVAGCAALAATLADANADPAAVRAGRYAIEPGHTRVLFAVSHMGFSTWYGDFTGAAGTLMLDPAHPELAVLEVTLPVGSVSTTNTVLDRELRGADWLDAQRYPTAVFRSTGVVVTGAGRAEVSGALTLHGVTRPLTLHVRFNAAGLNPLDLAYTAGFDADATLRRSDFGIKTDRPLIGDEVRLMISAPFERR
jgi:polyisoprenoid-binding protein YceI